MKKTLVYILLAITLLTGTVYLMPRPAYRGMILRDAKADTMITADSLTISDKAQEEFNYYFDRHNVLDEGYEMVMAFAAGKRLKTCIPAITSARNVGTWKDHERNGTAIVLDSIGRTVIATCHADTLVAGLRLDTAGLYAGDFHANDAHGHGAYFTPDGSYFEGHWEHDRRQGFGFELSKPRATDARLRVGEWNKGRFQGERMRYTSERIYGIDIAKYQHGRGRRPAPILWDRLRITHVGRKGSQNVSGEADYPVSFAYIKSTEGTSIRNKFYLKDYTDARSHGIPVGAYHFFSVRTPGAEQARHFIRNTLFRQGDLPPVLDIEPSEAQIRQMGGEEAMFRHIRIWLKAVERWTGVKPILYVNQMFVNRHLEHQPDLKHDYRVWIARYSEYKPDLRLTYWQLCPDGRVAGIQGHVDINVFNGYKSQFDEFIAKETISDH